MPKAAKRKTPSNVVQFPGVTGHLETGHSWSPKPATLSGGGCQINGLMIGEGSVRVKA